MSERIIKAVTALREQGPKLNLGDPRIMRTNLLFMYQLIVASEKLLEVAAKEAVPNYLRNYYRNHVEEERGHAQWLCDDLASADVVADSELHFRAAMELAGMQYYLIHHVNPAALLGYMAVLEGFPFDLEQLKVLETIHGERLLRCLRYHAENDRNHKVELFKVIDQLDDEDIYQNAVRTQLLLNEAFSKLC